MPPERILVDPPPPPQVRARILALCLPADTLLYLLLPPMIVAFDVSLAEAGVLLAANRLVRIPSYPAVAKLLATFGERMMSSAAIAVSALCAFGYALASGFAALLALRLAWGLAYATLALSWQSHAIASRAHAARRSGEAYAVVAAGPAIALPAGAWLAVEGGRTLPFVLLAAACLAALPFAARLPRAPESCPAGPDLVFGRPRALEWWAFLEGFVMDGLFIVAFAYLAVRNEAASAVLPAACVLAGRYVVEMLAAPLGGRLAESWGLNRVLLSLTVLTAFALLGFGHGFIWAGAAALVVLRALKLPLVQALTAMRAPGTAVTQQVARRNLWRDLGAGTGPLVAGVLLERVPLLWCFAAAALLMAVATVHVLAERPQDRQEGA